MLTGMHRGERRGGGGLKAGLRGDVNLSTSAT